MIVSLVRKTEITPDIPNRDVLTTQGMGDTGVRKLKEQHEMLEEPRD